MRDDAGTMSGRSAAGIAAGLLAHALLLRLVAVGDRLSHDEGYTWLVVSSGSS